MIVWNLIDWFQRKFDDLFGLILSEFFCLLSTENDSQKFKLDRIIESIVEIDRTIVGWFCNMELKESLLLDIGQKSVAIEIYLHESFYESNVVFSVFFKTLDTIWSCHIFCSEKLLRLVRMVDSSQELLRKWCM